MRVYESIAEAMQHPKAKALYAAISEENHRAIKMSGSAINQTVPCYIASQSHNEHLIWCVLNILEGKQTP